jgi:predicted metalloprotease with PDZ domain
MTDGFAKEGKTYRDSLDIRLTAEEIAGGSFEDFFRKYVAHAEPLPYQAILAKAGLLLQQQETVRAQLGFSYERDGGGKTLVRSVMEASPAERAGLLAGDEILSFNGENVPRRAEYWLRNKKPGKAVRLRVLRKERVLEVDFALGESSATIFVIAEDPHATQEAREIREGLLHGKPATAATAH